MSIQVIFIYEGLAHTLTVWCLVIHVHPLKPWAEVHVGLTHVSGSSWLGYLVCPFYRWVHWSGRCLGGSGLHLPQRLLLKPGYSDLLEAVRVLFHRSPRECAKTDVPPCVPQGRFW